MIEATLGKGDGTVEIDKCVHWARMENGDVLKVFNNVTAPVNDLPVAIEYGQWLNGHKMRAGYVVKYIQPAGGIVPEHRLLHSWPGEAVMPISRDWSCSYCGSRHAQSDRKCCNCGAPRMDQ